MLPLPNIFFNLFPEGLAGDYIYYCIQLLWVVLFVLQAFKEVKKLLAKSSGKK